MALKLDMPNQNFVLIPNIIMDESSLAYRSRYEARKLVAFTNKAHKVLGQSAHTQIKLTRSNRSLGCSSWVTFGSSKSSENFKSYKGKRVIGPFSKFSAIIGPNVSGKSNLMDAICFVLGEKTSDLRAKKVADLIHGAPINKPVAKRCHVSLTFVKDNKKTVVFTRAVLSNQSEYSIDAQPVPLASYTQELEKLHLFIKSKNFLVYQGQVEQIAMRNPKERTALFEEISKSNELKAEYEKRKVEMHKAEEDATFNYNKKRGILLEKREAKQEKEEAEKYQKLRDQVKDKDLQLHLCALYHNEKDTKLLQEQVSTKNEQVKKLSNTKQQVEERMHEKNKELKKVARDIKKLEIQISDMENGRHMNELMEAKEQVAHEHKELAKLNKALISSTAVYNDLLRQVHSCQESLELAQEQRVQYDSQLQEDLDEQQISLDDAQTIE